MLLNRRLRALLRISGMSLLSASSCHTWGRDSMHCRKFRYQNWSVSTLLPSNWQHANTTAACSMPNTGADTPAVSAEWSRRAVPTWCQYGSCVCIAVRLQRLRVSVTTCMFQKWHAMFQTDELLPPANERPPFGLKWSWRICHKWSCHWQCQRIQSRSRSKGMR